MATSTTKKEPSQALRDLSVSLATNQQTAPAPLSPATTPSTQDRSGRGTKESPLTATQINDLASQGIREGDNVPGKGILLPGGYFNTPAQNTQGSYSSIVKNELGATPDTPAVDTKSQYNTQLEDARKKRESAFKNLENLTTKTFDDEYKTRGLEKTKTEMATIDNEIARLKAERDTAINKVRTNPGLSAAQMAGDIKKMADFQNEKINTEIMRRNGLAEQYNKELETIDRIVQNKAKDAQMQFGYWDSMFNETRSMQEQYDKLLREEFLSDRDQDNFEKQLAQQLQIAQMRDSSGGGSAPRLNLQLVRDPVTDQPMYWWNPQTGDINYLNETEQGGGNQPQNFENLSTAETDKGPGLIKRAWNWLTGK